MLPSKTQLKYSFPEREPINRNNFALQHLLLEIIKSKILDNKGDPLLSGKLTFLADSLSVERTVGSPKRFSIRVNGREILTAPTHEFVFFRGPVDVLPDGQSWDSVLESNVARATHLVNQLVQLDLDRSGPTESNLGIEVSCIVVFSSFLGDASSVISNILFSLEAQAKGGGWIRHFEVVVVDDGSLPLVRDELLRMAKLHKSVHLVTNPSAEGLGASFAYGLEHCSLEYVLFFEAAENLETRELEKLFSQASHFEVVVPYRQGSAPKFSRLIAVKGWSVVTRILLGYLAHDIDSNLKLFSRKSLERIGYRYIRGHSGIFNTELLARMRRAGIAIKEIPLQCSGQEANYQRSFNIGSVIRGLFSLLYLRYLLGIERLSWFGFVTGMFSRTSRPLEMLEYRHSDILWREEDPQDLTCPICAAHNASLRRTQLHETSDSGAPGKHGVMLCLGCRNAFTVPRDAPVPDTLVDVPGKSSLIESALISWFLKTRVKRVLGALSPQLGPFKVLDIGGGSCSFANAMARRGHSIAVIDPHPQYQLVAKETGVSFYPMVLEEGSIQGLGFTSQFDAVTLWHSLEHFNDPRTAIKEALQALKPEGVLYLCVPNINSLQAEISGQSWAYLDVPRHRIHFSLDGTQLLLRALHFNRHHVHWWSSEYEIFGFFQSILNMLSGSHNFFYNRKKKGTSLSAPSSIRNSWVHRFSFLLLPISFLLSIIACAIGKPACVEIYSYKESDD